MRTGGLSCQPKSLSSELDARAWVAFARAFLLYSQFYIHARQPAVMVRQEATPPGFRLSSGDCFLRSFGNAQRNFCDALLSLPVGLLNGRCVTFLGKEADFRVRDIRSTLTPLEQHGIKIVFLTNYNTLEARRYLCGNGILAIMPSLQENSPCTVSECLEHRVPFLTSSVGGGKELVHEEDRAFAIFDPRPSCLAERLRDILGGQGIIAARPSQSSDALLQQWQNILQRLTPSAANGRTSKFFRY